MTDVRLSAMAPFTWTDGTSHGPWADLVRSGRVHRLWQGQGFAVDTFQGFAAEMRQGGFAAGVAVSLMPLRHPYDAAMQARSLGLLSGSDLVVAYGPGGASFQSALLGSPYARPVSAAREYADVVRRLLRGDAVEQSGGLVDLAACLPPIPVTPRVEVGLGVLRPRMAFAAGEVADVAVTWLAPAAHVAGTLRPAIERGALAAGRDDVARVVAVVPVCPEGLDPVRVMLAGNGAHLAQDHYRDALRRAGVPLDGDPVRDATALVQAGMIAHGTPDQAVEILGRYVDAGVSEIVLSTTGTGMLRGPDAARDAVAEISARWPHPAGLLTGVTSI